MTRNRELLERVARRARPLLDEVVFVGGAVVELYVTQPVSERVRPTEDTDAICEVADRAGYRRLTGRLEKVGFKQSAIEADPPFRWRTEEGDVLDLMPTDPNVLGFANRWHEEGLEHSVSYALGTDLRIEILAPPYFLASKLEAYRGRGRNDPHGSADFEDAVVLIGNRPELSDEVAEADPELRRWLRRQFAEYFPEERQDEYLAAHLPVGRVEDLLARARSRVERIREAST